MLIYLAGPIEANMVQGNAFRQRVKSNLRENPMDRIVVYDPFMPFEYSNLGKVDFDIRNANRAVLAKSGLVLALLTGCETWREIEFASSLPHGPPIWGCWPIDANKSPIAEFGVKVFDDVEGMMAELRQS